jgi:hypothetical protein
MIVCISAWTLYVIWLSVVCCLQNCSLYADLYCLLYSAAWHLAVPRTLLLAPAVPSTTMDSCWLWDAAMALSGFSTYVVVTVLIRGWHTREKHWPFSWLPTSQSATLWDLMGRQVAHHFIWLAAVVTIWQLYSYTRNVPYFLEPRGSLTLVPILSQMNPVHALSS